MENYFGYIENLEGNGWIRVKLDSGLIWPLPEYLRVHVKKSDSREDFKILEGRFKGETASVKKKGWRWTEWDWDKSYFEEEIHLKENCIHKESAELIFYKKSKKLEIKGLGKFNAITDTTNPTPNGVFDLEIPYEPHPSNSRYAGDANYYKTWFRVGHSGDRFLHCGRVSAGCITVTDINKWDQIYRSLIVSRKGLDNIGSVKVVDA